MEVILLETINNLGNLGDKVTVKPGYGRNFLIPGGKALPATEANVAEFEARRAELEKVEAEKLAAAEARKVQIDGASVTIARKAGDEGKLFGSVGTVDIAEAMTAAGNEVTRQRFAFLKVRSVPPASTTSACTCTAMSMRRLRSLSSQSNY